MILYKAPEIYGCLIFLAEGSNLLCIIFLMSLPLSEVRSAVHVTEHAECSVRKEPMTVSLHECLVCLSLRKFRKLLVECLSKKFKLGIVHSLVIDLRQSVEFCLKFLVGLCHRDSGSRKIDELWMKSEGRISIVRIRIFPGSSHCGIVDRKKLKNALAC